MHVGNMHKTLPFYSSIPTHKQHSIGIHYVFKLKRWSHALRFLFSLSYFILGDTTAEAIVPVSICHKVVLLLIPVLICWMLWENRNKGRYDGTNVLIGQIIREMEETIRYILQSSVILEKKGN